MLYLTRSSGAVKAVPKIFGRHYSALKIRLKIFFFLPFSFFLFTFDKTTNSNHRQPAISLLYAADDSDACVEINFIESLA